MARLARIVISGSRTTLPSAAIAASRFFSEDDYAAYVELVSASCAANGVRCLA